MDRNRDMKRESDEINQDQPLSGEDTRGAAEEEFGETAELEEEEADELESDERVTGEVGSEGGGEGDVEVNPSPTRERKGSY
jgi:hypothetical protein